MTLNIVGFALAVAATILYSKSIANFYIYWICEDDYSDKSQWQKLYEEKCSEKTALTKVSVKYCICIVYDVLDSRLGHNKTLFTPIGEIVLREKNQQKQKYKNKLQLESCY